jgi:YgiT-type zinc finger domain-containing protein
MKCPVCGAVELIHGTRDLPYTCKGETPQINAVTGDFGPACAESVLEAAESERVMREMRAFAKLRSKHEAVQLMWRVKLPCPSFFAGRWRKGGQGNRETPSWH